MSDKQFDESIALRPLGEWIIVDLSNDFGEKKTKSGLVIIDDDYKEWGIRPRWGKVLAVGPKAMDADISVGDKILIEHGEWTRRIKMETVDGPRWVWGVPKLESVLLKDYDND